MQEKRVHQIFVVSVLFKGIHALIEIVGGIALYLISTDDDRPDDPALQL